MVLPEGSRTRLGEGNGCEGDTPLCHLVVELDATLKNHSWLLVFSFSEEVHGGQRNSKVVNGIGSQCKAPIILPA